MNQLKDLKRSGRTTHVCYQCGVEFLGDLVRYVEWIFCSWECKKEFREERD